MSQQFNSAHSSEIKDHQFQVHTLAEDSSDNSEKQENDIDSKLFYELSDEGSSKSVKSSEDLSSSYHTSNEQNEGFVIHHSSKEIEEIDQQETTLNGVTNQLNKENENQKSKTPEKDLFSSRKKKRQRIFNNIKQASNEKSKAKVHKFKDSFTEEEAQAIKEQNVLSRISFEKKRENHFLIKAWNYRRIQMIEFHKKICDQMIRGIDKLSKLSLDNFETFRSFFTQKCRQHEIIVNSKATLPITTVEENAHSRHIYISCSTVIRNMAKREKEEKRITNEFVSFIQNRILKEIFDDYFGNVHKEFMLLRNKVSTMNEALKKVDESICKKLIKVEEIFTKCCENVMSQSCIDFYRAEISFLSKCESEVMLQSKLGDIVLDYYLSSVKEEEKRKILLEKSLMLYTQKYLQYQQDITQSQPQENALDLIENQGESSLIKQAYELDTFFDEQTILEIHEKVKPSGQLEVKRSNNMELADVQKILQEEKELELEDKNGRQEVWIPGELVITIDRFIHVFAYAQKSSGALIYGSHNYLKPEFTCKIQCIQLLTRNEESDIKSDDDLEVVLSANKEQTKIEKLTSLLKNSRINNEIIKFSQEDDLFEFQDYLLELSS